MATVPKRKNPTDVRGALEQRALDHGHVFVVLQVPATLFDDAITQPMPVLRAARSTG